MAGPSTCTVDRLDRLANDFHATLRGFDQNFAFEYKRSCGAIVHSRLRKQTGRVDTESRLGVLDRLPGGPADPEIGESISAIARQRYCLSRVQSRADNDAAWRRLPRFQQERN